MRVRYLFARYHQKPAMELGPLQRFEGDAWMAALGTALGYGIILLVMVVVLFLIPYAVYTLL